MLAPGAFSFSLLSFFSPEVPDSEALVSDDDSVAVFVALVVPVVSVVDCDASVKVLVALVMLVVIVELTLLMVVPPDS